MHKVLVIDFGSQYCKLIARRVREAGVFSEIVPANKENVIDIAQNYDAIILSGGPNSVFDNNSLSIDKKIFDLNKPILGTCYGMQIIHHLLGGKVETLSEGEYGKMELSLTSGSHFVDGVSERSIVWMSHFDTVTKLAPGFKLLGKTKLSNAISANEDKKIYTTQFHPEVNNTEFGKQMIENFLFKISKLKPTWKMNNIAEEKINEAKNTIKDDHVILGLSGGVDSSVVAALLHKAIGKNLTSVFIDNGLLRKNEVEKVQKLFKDGLKLNLVTIDAKENFYKALKGITDPEQKRKAIGRVFVEEFTKVKKQFSNAKFLAQGTIYPDIIESAGVNGTAHVIKSHHNVGGLPDDVDFEIYEPLKDLFKDEVRELGKELGLPDDVIMRHPFPGPGLGIRIIGEINEKSIKTLQDVDDILITNLIDANLYHSVSQAAAMLTPIKTVGVQGDERTYKNLVALRMVNTNDFMTASFSRIDFDFLEKVSTEIINKVEDVNRVVYDITSKPPGTIEWE